MQLTNVLLASTLALSASAAVNVTSIAPAIQARFAQLDFGYQEVTAMLTQLGDETAGITADDVVSLYNSTVAMENKDLGKGQPPKPFTESTQLVICQSFHSLALNGVGCNEAFVTNAKEFNEAQRNDLQEGLTRVNDETGRFLSGVAKYALPYCAATVKVDDSAITKSIHAASAALDPSEASS